MNLAGEVSQEALQKSGGCFAIASGMDLKIDVARGAIDGDESIAFTLFKSRQVLEIHMDETDPGVLKSAHRRFDRFGSAADAMALETAMDGAAGELVIHATAHDLDDIIERQIQRGAQLANQFLFRRCERDAHALRPVRAIRRCGTAAPAPDSSFADAQLSNEFGDRSRAALNVGPDLGCRQLIEQMQYNMLFRWFVGLSIDDPVWVPTVFSQNRDRLLTTDIARKFLAAILADKAVAPLLSDEHFSVDGTLIEAWASI